jgi:antitoxin component YwqK of YwqJK toxin-antitoxin module
MKKIFYLIIPIFICSISVGQSLPSYTIENGDTLNFTDANNLKQGFWKIFGRMRKAPGYQPDQVVEEGEYANSRKQGIWKKFFSTGKTKSEIEYKNSRPNGKYKTYFENGQVEEEGNWKSNRNTGDFKRYYENGQVSQQFAFNTSGKRDGDQTYFYENGQVMIEAKIEAGKEQFVKEYYEDGSVKSEKSYIDGKLDAANTKVYESTTPVEEKKDEGVEKVVTIDKKTEEANDGDGFNGTGYKKMYNKNKELSKVGVFENFRLMDGKFYRYDADGILFRIEIFKKGRHIGNAPLPKE